MILLAEIEVGQTTYYVADRSYAGFHFYYPYVDSLPSLELGQVEDSGKIGVKFGSLTLINSPLDANHPFGLNRYTGLLTEQNLYPCRIRWGENGRTLFDGNIYLSTIDEERISFSFTEKTYELGARPFSLTEAFVFVEGVTAPSNGDAIQITSQAHGLQTGVFVIFERMDSIGEELEYQGPPVDNYYIVNSVISPDVFTLQTKDFLPVKTLSSSNTGSIVSDGLTHRVGIPQRVPFTWGSFEHQTPVLKKKDNEIANPGLVLNSATNPIEVREDGVLIYSTNPSSSEYWDDDVNGSGVAPTEKTITLNSQTVGGTLSISGESTRGTTLAEFFTYVAQELRIGTDLSYA